MGSADVNDIPAGLPVADGSLNDLFLGTAISFGEETTPVENETEDELGLKDLEDVAHQERALISSDALRFLRDRIPAEDQEHLLRSLISRGRTRLPLEDGWLILNLERIEQLYDGGMPLAAEDEVVKPLSVEPTGSLAEAVLAGNVIAAYALIDRRPMMELASAVADLDGIYRLRKGGEGTTNASELLKEETKAISTDMLERVIRALSSALDGTYQDEEAAVKMAILQAIKVLKNK